MIQECTVYKWKWNLDLPGMVVVTILVFSEVIVVVTDIANSVDIGLSSILHEND